MMKKDITHIKGIGFDDGTDTIVKSIMESERVSYAHAVRILIRIAYDMLDMLDMHPDLIEGYTDSNYSWRIGE